MKDLLKYFKGYIRESLLGPLFKLLEASFELLVPILIAGIVDETIPRHDSSHLYWMVFLLMGLAALGVVVAVVAQYYSSKAAVGFTRQMTSDLYQKILRLPKASRDELTTSSLVTRLTSDTYQIQTGINQFLRLFLRAPIIVFGSIIMAVTISPVITLWFLLMVAILTAIIVFMSRLMNPLYAKIRQLTDQLVNLTREHLQGMRVIRAFGQTQREVQTFRNRNELYKTWQIRTGALASLISPLTFLTVNGTLIAVIWQGNAFIGKGLLTQGMLVALVNYLLQILVELLKLAMLVNSLNQSYISAGRISQVFEQAEEDVLQELVQETALPNQAIKVQQVSFSYPNAASPALTGLTFDLKRGQTLGVIGGGGSGEATLVPPLGHFYDVTLGKIKVDGVDVRDYRLKSLRQKIGFIPQKALLFTGTIADNLRYGKEDASHEDLHQAADVAQAKDFIESREEGFATHLAEGGSNLSGGQKQRLSIARAVIKGPDIYIFDDSFSALDYRTDAILRRRLKEVTQDATVLIVAQRVGTIMDADQIIVLDKGEIVGRGRHEELMESNAIYREIAQSQLNSQSLTGE